jgi:hypothetical protein
MSSFFKIKTIIFLLAVFLLAPFFLEAATLELALEKDIASAQDDVTVLITINSEDQEVNTAQATISFPANLLEITEVDRAGSIFSFWLEEPVYDNSQGTIRFVGGSTSGFSGSSLRLMKVSFRVKGSGSGRLSVTDGAITASDGTGSNVYTTAKGLDINIPTTSEFQAVKLERIDREATIAKELPSRLGIDIPFYPDSEEWNNRSASFQAKWKISSDTSQAAVAVDDKPNTVPKASAEALTGSKIFPALADGVWYLHLRLANNIGWSPTLHYRIAVDTTPPTPFEIISDEGFETGNPTPTINFLSSDLTSGMDNYIIRLDGEVATTTSLTSYQFEPILPGTHQLIVAAVDKAGNATSQKVDLKILPIDSPKISYVNNLVIVNEGAITAGGTAIPEAEVIVQVQNSQEQVVAEQIAPVDINGNWSITITKALNTGDYHLLITARDKTLASSFPVRSELIKIRPRPVLILGGIAITQTWFFVGLIVLLLGSFGTGWFAYYRWRGQLGRRVVIAQRDVVNILNNIEKDLNKLIKNSAGGELTTSEITEMKYTLKEMSKYIEKSRRYVVDNIREIGD